MKRKVPNITAITQNSSWLQLASCTEVLTNHHPGCLGWDTAVPDYSEGFGTAASLHCCKCPQHQHLTQAWKNICAVSSQNSTQTWRHAPKFSVITIGKQVPANIAVAVSKCGDLNFVCLFLNSDTLLSNCSNLQDCGAACASTENTAEDRKKARLLDLCVSLLRGFLELRMSLTRGDLFLQLPQILSVLSHRSSVFIYIFKSLHCVIF